MCRQETGLPGSPPPTPAYEAEDRRGKCYDKTAFGIPSFHAEIGVDNLLGGPAGGPEQPTRFGSGSAGDKSTWRSSSGVTSIGRGRTHELGARAKTRDSHGSRQPRSKVSGTPAAAGLDSAHRGGSGSPADVSDNSDTLAVEARQLQREISRLQRDIKTLSARRSRRVRAEIAVMFHSDSSPDLELSTEPPRTVMDFVMI